MKHNYFNVDGMVRLAEKQGKPQKPKDVTEENRKKQICLTCDKPKCKGNCKRVNGGG